ncbi:hypothetical protein [Paenibacillus agricola]|uniref:Uncharacterized protein n=1 Tax=Paenibacillus agricola TaxID=2716264 RepID=A0ABX0J6Z4_9BACL|nr:hypothetical protein [Paenibacillus agricola]NHN31180.1 hypothetical protein [Paenibacillus agricola]
MLTQFNDRLRNRKTTRFPAAVLTQKITEVDTFLLYNGGAEEYEDVADYYRGGRILGRVIA